MSLHPHHNESTATVDLLSAIDELAENTRAHVINSRRGNNRVELNCVVRVTPANASDRGKFLIEGRCRDVSPTGGRLILDQPLLVGDVYLIYIEGEQFRLDPTFVRCIRCHLIREGDFECGVSFLSPVDLESAPANTSAAPPVPNVTPTTFTPPVSNTPPAAPVAPVEAAPVVNTAPVVNAAPVFQAPITNAVEESFAPQAPAVPAFEAAPVPAPAQTIEPVAINMPTPVAPVSDASTLEAPSELNMLPASDSVPAVSDEPALREEARTEQVQIRPNV